MSLTAVGYVVIVTGLFAGVGAVGLIYYLLRHRGKAGAGWFINWCVTMLDGDIAFSYDNGNVVTVTVPEL